MAKETLNDRGLKALKPAKTGTRYERMDKVVGGFGIRVTDKGAKTFILIARYPGSTNPTRRALGEYGVLTLEKARQKARDWIELIGRGIDPAEQEERLRLAEQQKRKNTFAAVAEDFIVERLPSERRGKDVERDIRHEFVPKWGDLPITEITDLQIIAYIKNKKRTAPVQARNLLALLKRFFSWAIDQRVYGLAASPCALLKPSSLIGEKAHGKRILTDDELFALWRSAKRMPYPHGPVYQLLTLTALRLNEVARASWPEFGKLADRVWVIPSERMKGKNSKARAHAVPLTDDMLAILKALPRFKGGAYLFSTKFGKTPTVISNRVKKRLDGRMLRTLKAVARKRGDDSADVELPPWTNHDIRRTVRSQLSRLKITEEAREAVMAHVRPGIKGVYDLHDYSDEKLEALTQWAARLRMIVEPAPANVIAIKARA